MLKISFSWDDGAKEDLKLLHYIEKYEKLDHTFYIPANNIERSVLKSKDIKILSSYGQIGSHTYNHIFLDTIPLEKIQEEVINGKKYLEDILGYEINDFCYPGGKYNKQIENEVKKFVNSARTTNLMTCSNSNQFTKNTTLQLVYRKKTSLLKHILAFAPLSLKYKLIKIINNEYKLIDIIRVYLDYYEKNQSKDLLLHIWGHSWEIEDNNLWSETDAIFKLLSEYQ